jgi:hypothetical protein
MKACRFDWACKAPPILSMALLFILVSVQQVSAQIVALPAFNVDIAQTSVSGLSSGGYMAAWMPG